VHLPEALTETKQYLLDQGLPDHSEAAIILGSGLGSFTKHIRNQIRIPYQHIPHFPETSVEGHRGELISGNLSGHSILAFSGRFHHYEGYSFSTTVLPVHLSKHLGIKNLIITNAAGGINTKFRVGDLMIIDSVLRLNHITAPFTKKSYHLNLDDTARKAGKLAEEIGVFTQKGTYIFVKGPNYETKAEIRSFRIMGADAVGMSTVPELSEASRLNLKTTAVSLITNMAAGVAPGKMDHADVKEAARTREQDFTKLVKYFIMKL
jgi:purine-nucleoside phosphorylase